MSYESRALSEKAWNRRTAPTDAGGAVSEAARLALEDADALDRTAEDADENNWQDWGATMRQAAIRIRALAALTPAPQAEGEAMVPREELRQAQIRHIGTVENAGAYLCRAEKAEAKIAHLSGGEGVEAQIEDAWQSLLDDDDRTSPEEYPDHVLITRADLAAHMGDAAFIARTSDPSPQPIQQGGEVTRSKADVMGVLSGAWADGLPLDQTADAILALFASLAADRDKAVGLLREMKAAFGDPMTRRALGGHNESQMEAILQTSAFLSSQTEEG